MTPEMITCKAPDCGTVFPDRRPFDAEDPAGWDWAKREAFNFCKMHRWDFQEYVALIDEWKRLRAEIAALEESDLGSEWGAGEETWA
jgi:hypothetical protein